MPEGLQITGIFAPCTDPSLWGLGLGTVSDERIEVAQLVDEPGAEEFVAKCGLQ
jgi:hypothetical protein